MNSSARLLVGLGLTSLALTGCFKGGETPNDDSSAATESESGASESGTETETGFECPEGSESCPCLPGGECEPGLFCAGSGICTPEQGETETGEELCGNGTLDDDEECDDGDENGDDQACTSDCRMAICGDGLIQAGVEDCDTGVESANCDEDCTIPACGDGVVNELAGETCDDGNLDPNDDCTDQCLLATCGDGVVNANEECDDGNLDPDDDCTPDCKSLWWAEGPQIDVPQANLVGWELCWSGLYGTASEPLMTILGSNCTKSKLLIACRPVAETDLTLLAMGEREAVIFNTGDGNVPYNHNGVGFYYSDSYSWGFALEGDPIQRFSCDVGSENPQFRMCWHSNSGNLSSGYRCGTTTLNGNNNWTRMIFQAD